jgi:predicted TIM-barrel fold metal-dependent hydrolase
MKLSEYLDRNIYLAASTAGVDENERRHEIGVHNLLWGNDLPHPEGAHPHMRRWINEQVAAMPQHEARAILGENAVELYRLDRDVLDQVAARIGPTPEDVHVPSTEPLPA